MSDRLDDLHVAISGQGPTLLLVHGSATDAEGWAIQRVALAERYRLVTYDRRGTERSPLPPGTRAYTVEAHARDAAAVIARDGRGPVVVVGSSFGAVVALELARSHRTLVRGLVLCEPPLAPTDDAAPAHAGFRAEFDATYREQGGEAAAELFLRAVLGDAGFERIPPTWRPRLLAMHDAIALDIAALGDYRPRYAALREVRVPALLLGGDRSAAYFAPTLAALEAALPQAQRQTLRGAGHMMHADASRQFHAALDTFVASLPA